MASEQTKKDLVVFNYEGFVPVVDESPVTSVIDPQGAKHVRPPKFGSWSLNR